MMMNFKKIAVLLTIILFGAVSCTKSTLIESEELLTDNDNVVSFAVKAPTTAEVASSTRAAASDPKISINYGYLFFFDAQGAYIDKFVITSPEEVIDNGTVNPKIEITTPGYSNSCKLICVFNYDKSNFKSDFTELTKDNLSSYFPINAAFLKKIENSYNDQKFDVAMPMFVNDFEDVVAETGHEIYRAVARMSIAMPSDGLKIPHGSHFHTVQPEDLTYTFVNQAVQGAVDGATDLTSAIYNGIDELTFDLAVNGYKNKDDDHSLFPKNYLFAFPYSTKAVNGTAIDPEEFTSDRFAIILKHQDTYQASPSPVLYYKLNLVDKVLNSYFDVKPNHDYRIVITGIYSRGYESLEEAYKMPPSNIEYEIYDDQGELTLSNGQYAISMDELLDYDEMLVYGENETVVEFNDIRYLKPDGGQMEGMDFITNEVYFEVKNSDGSLIAVSSSDFNFVDNKSELTPNGKSIKLTLTGFGECNIALKIKLGNLEVGRDNIKIKKVDKNGGGNGAFDAHPNHFEIPDQEYVEGSWQSNNLDFGARSTIADVDDCGEGGTVIYMGENATPTGFRTMDGLLSGQYSVNSYPVFSPKTRTGYYSYIKDDGDVAKVMIQLDQLAPFYLGHFGRTAPEDPIYHYNGVICEKIEEIPSYDWTGSVISENDGVMPWSNASGIFYREKAIYADAGFGPRYQNFVEGRDITEYMVENNRDVNSMPLAARYCYMKNDVNGDGVIDPLTEPISWYLPAQNQALAMWINLNVFDTDDDLYKLNNQQGDSQNYYWTCSEVDGTDYVGYIPSIFTEKALALNTLEGQSEMYEKNASWQQWHVRCVRGLASQFAQYNHN